MLHVVFAKADGKCVWVHWSVSRGFMFVGLGGSVATAFWAVAIVR